MGFARRRLNLMAMRVVSVVVVFMVVFQRLVRVFMAVALCQVQPDSKCHQRASGQQSRADGLPQQRQGQRRAKEGRHGKIRAGARRTEMPQGYHEQGQTDAISQPAEQHRAGEVG